MVHVFFFSCIIHQSERVIDTGFTLDALHSPTQPFFQARGNEDSLHLEWLGILYAHRPCPDAQQWKPDCGRASHIKHVCHYLIKCARRVAKLGCVNICLFKHPPFYGQAGDIQVRDSVYH